MNCRKCGASIEYEADDRYEVEYSVESAKEWSVADTHVVICKNCSSFRKKLIKAQELRRKSEEFHGERGVSGGTTRQD